MTTDQGPPNKINEIKNISTTGLEAKASTFTFDASRGRFFRLLLVNSALTLITIGVYRFWARTRIRRFMWHHVRILGDPLEYTGTGAELFLGFLIVLAVLFPLGLVYSAIAGLVPPDQVGLQVSLEIAYYTVIIGLIHIGLYRMWRYRLSRTAWRGIRFSLQGSTWSYLKLALLWDVLWILTLGFMMPWREATLWRYQIQHTRFGQQAFRFHGTPQALLRPWLMVWLTGMVFLVGAGLLGFMIAGNGQFDLSRPSNITPDIRNLFIVAIGTLTLSAITFPFTYLYFLIRLTRWKISGLALADARFNCDLRFGRLLAFATLALALVAIFTGLAALIPVLWGTPIYTDGQINPLLLLLGGFIGFVLLTTVVPTIWMTVFSFEAVKQTVRRSDLDQPSALERAAQAADAGPRTGEGFADAFDLGGGF